MTDLIAEPCLDVADWTCVDECPVDCIDEGDRASYIHPDDASTVEHASRFARSRRSSTRTTCPASGRALSQITPGLSPVLSRAAQTHR